MINGSLLIFSAKSHSISQNDESKEHTSFQSMVWLIKYYIDWYNSQVEAKHLQFQMSLSEAADFSLGKQSIMYWRVSIYTVCHDLLISAYQLPGLLSRFCPAAHTAFNKLDLVSPWLNFHVRERSILFYCPDKRDGLLSMWWKAANHFLRIYKSFTKQQHMVPSYFFIRKPYWTRELSHFSKRRHFQWIFSVCWIFRSPTPPQKQVCPIPPKTTLYRSSSLYSFYTKWKLYSITTHRA